MKRLLFMLSFAVAVVSAFAFTKKPASVSAHYLSGMSCASTAQTNEANCIVGGLHAQCTVNVAANPAAWHKDDCTEPLNIP